MQGFWERISSGPVANGFFKSSGEMVPNEAGDLSVQKLMVVQGENSGEESSWGIARGT